MNFFSCKLNNTNFGGFLRREEQSWTFLSNHGHVYLLIAKKRDLTVREIALKVGITERSVQKIIFDLEADNYIKRDKVGRSNNYKIIPRQTLRHPLEKNVKTKDLVQLISDIEKN